MELQSNLAEFAGRNAEVWSISIDPVETLTDFAAKQELTFPLLSDPDSATIKAYGFLNEEQGKLPHPAAVILDPRGCVTYVRVDEGVVDRPPVEELLAALDAGPCAASDDG